MRSTQSISSINNTPESPRLIETGRGLTVQYRNRFLYSRIDPRKKPEEIAGALELREDTLVIVPGPLLGYGLDVIAAALKPGDHVLCLEIDQSLMALSLDHIDPAILDDARFSFVRTDSPYGAVRYLERKKLTEKRRTEYVPLSGSAVLNEGIYRRFLDAIDRAVKRYWENRMTLVHMGRLWIRNLFTNLPSFANRAETVFRKIDKPIVIAGAGESLESALPWIAENRTSVYLICVDTALGSLAQAGIPPDLVVALDAQHANLKDFYGTGNVRFLVAADITAYPQIIRRAGADVCFFSSEFASIRLFARLREWKLLPTGIPPLGSVGLAALYLALTLTDVQVLLAGLDFSFVPGKPHAKGAPSHSFFLSSARRLAPLPLYRASDVRPFLRTLGKAGTTVVTDFVLASYGRDAMDIVGMYPGRVTDAGVSGLPLGIPSITDSERISDIIRRAGRSAGDNGGDTASDRAETNATSGEDKSTAIREFLSGEENLLSRFIDGGNRLLSQAGKEREVAFSPELCRLLEELDYVYMDFPDVSFGPAESRSFLARAIASALYYRKRILQALNG